MITRIVPVDPDNFPALVLGQPFTIFGSGFSSQCDANKIMLGRSTPTGDVEIIAVFIPTNAASEKLEAVCPSELAVGPYVIWVKAAGLFSSLSVDVAVYAPPLPAAHIDNVTPATQLPTKRVTINGTGFSQNSRVFWKALDPTNDNAMGYAPCDAEFVSSTQLQFSVPERLVGYGGEYLIAACGDNQLMSNWVGFNVQAFKYLVDFTKMKCIDESSPEWFGDDELVTRWVIAADEAGWTKQSKEYGGFSDNVEKAYDIQDGHIFSTSGGPGEVQKHLLIGTVLLEWDEGDVKAWTEVIEGFADIVKKIPVVGDWFGSVLKGLPKLLSWFGGDPDTLGEKTLTFSASELFAKTNNPGLSFAGTQSFLNDADTGSYELSYKITRSGS